MISSMEDINMKSRKSGVVILSLQGERILKIF